jgi:Domain of unknown function (DUF4157)
MLAPMDPHAEHESEQRTFVPEPPAVERAEAATPLQALAGGVGNRSFSQFVARMRDGEGILPGGVVHPQVEAAIAAARGGGRPLDSGVTDRIAPALGDSLSDVRVHTGEGAAALARAVSARAFTVGNDIFFGDGEYQPHSRDGGALIAHEAAHAIQQRGAPASGPLTVSQPGDALEREADAVARQV